VSSLRDRRPNGSALHFVVALIAIGAFYTFCFYFAEVDLRRLWDGLPRLAHWAGRAWPPDFSDLATLLTRAAETLAMATLGTTLGALIAVPLCLLAARNIAPSAILYLPARWFLNILRGIDSFVFALLFVAAVGLGPFAGVLGVSLHSAGSIAKLWSENVETVERGPSRSRAYDRRWSYEGRDLCIAAGRAAIARLGRPLYLGV
jgi:phosphonate transport system permease protein